ncbi:MAG: restriction endonuclease subunit S [Verrucomicrobiota bacterium]
MSTSVMLSDVAQLVMGQSPPSTSYNDVGDGRPFYQGKTDFGATYPTPRIYCRDPKKIAEPGDILMSVRAPVGSTNLSNSKACIGRGIAAIRAHGIDRDFLYFYLKKIETYIDSLGSGAIFKAINKLQLAELPINEAGITLPEQKKIAEILSTVQRAIEEQERIIQTTTELKKALMQKLFTEGLRNEPQKQTEIGPIPESWEVVPLGSLAKVGNGSTPKRANEAYWKGGTIPWLNSTKIHDRFITEADQFVTPQAVSQCHLPKVAPNSLLIAITGQGKTLGNSAITRIETCINQHLAYAQFHSHKIVPEFVLWFMQTRYDYLRSIAHGGGSTKGALTCGFLKTLPIPVPARAEQKEITATFQAIENKKTRRRRPRRARGGGG